MISDAAHGTMSAQRTSRRPGKRLVEELRERERDQDGDGDDRRDPDDRVRHDGGEVGLREEPRVVPEIPRGPGRGR